MNKEQQSLDELKDLVHSELDGTRMLDEYLKHCDTLQKLVNQQSNPTLSECIKEWEDNGCFITESNKELIIESCEDFRDLDITICKANLIYETSNYYRNKPACISPDLHHLLSKTLKALEVENELEPKKKKQPTKINNLGNELWEKDIEHMRKLNQERSKSWNG